MFSRLLYYIFLLFTKLKNLIPYLVFIFIISIVLTLAAGKIYQHWDNDKDRGAIALIAEKFVPTSKTEQKPEAGFAESFKTPIYLKEKDNEKAQQGWSKADSLWFYSATQGSALLPYDFFIELEVSDSNKKFISPQNIDRFRYLVQKKTFSNPDGLPVGFAKETYRGGGNSCFDNLFGGIFGGGKDYVGYTCAGCHTSQINYKDPDKKDAPATAIRIDGGPAMADMEGFLESLEKALTATLNNKHKLDRFIKNVKNRDNDYGDDEEIRKDLELWAEKTANYNLVNHSSVKYGYARLDAFGRIYNRLLEHIINKPQLEQRLYIVTDKQGRQLLNQQQTANLLKGVEGEIILGQKMFTRFMKNLHQLGLSEENKKRVLSKIFNEANAPVSYPFLWDIAQSDYVQWNGLASNAGIGPLGRNAGEVVGVFAILDWHEDNGCLTKLKAILPDFITSPSAWISGQKEKKKQVNFKSSVDIVNLKRLESMLRRLKSPMWPQDIFGKIDDTKLKRGKLHYDTFCLRCHEVINRDDWSRRVTAKLEKLKPLPFGTDPVMANNSVDYRGVVGNFKNTVQETSVGKLVLQDEAPVAQTLSTVVRGVIATPDPDKWFFRRWADRIYTIVMSFADNKIKATMKAGNYNPDTTAQPFASLKAYKARSLNGIWATAPYLHNGSVPTLYHLLKPVDERPKEFYVCKREFDKDKVGFVYEEKDFSDLSDKEKEACKFDTSKKGNSNAGHIYGAVLNPDEIDELLEYLKSL